MDSILFLPFEVYDRVHYSIHQKIQWKWAKIKMLKLSYYFNTTMRRENEWTKKNSVLLYFTMLIKRVPSFAISSDSYLYSATRVYLHRDVLSLLMVLTERKCLSDVSSYEQQINRKWYLNLNICSYIFRFWRTTSTIINDFTILSILWSLTSNPRKIAIWRNTFDELYDILQCLMNIK
jgi:hypothetical protein